MKFKSVFLAGLIFLNLLWYGCSSADGVTAVDCSLSDLSISVESKVRSDCNAAGSITVLASGGTGSYLYSSNGIDFQSSPVLDGLFAGNHQLIVKDTDGCTSSIATDLESEPGAVTLALEAANSGCGTSNGTITVNANGGVPPYTFSLNNGAAQSANIFSNVSGGLNQITVLDSDDCQVSAGVVVKSGVSLVADVMPIVSSNCAVTGCHNGSRFPDLRSADAVRSFADRIKTRTSERTMPPADRASLSQSDIDRIACWVDDGAPNN